jgi:hypothetical protein
VRWASAAAAGERDPLFEAWIKQGHLNYGLVGIG